MAKKVRFDFDLIVIGSGAGGSAAASIAARRGLRVAIVEADTFGAGMREAADYEDERDQPRAQLAPESLALQAALNAAAREQVHVRADERGEDAESLRRFVGHEDGEVFNLADGV